MKDKHHLLLTVLLSIFIVFDIKVPLVLAELVDNPLGKIMVAALSLCLLSMNLVAGVVSLVAAFVLIQRSSESTGTVGERNYMPTEAKKTVHLSAMNQFPVTVEEEVISKMLPSTGDRDASPAEYKPVMGDIHDASMA